MCIIIMYVSEIRYINFVNKFGCFIYMSWLIKYPNFVTIAIYCTQFTAYFYLFLIQESSYYRYLYIHKTFLLNKEPILLHQSVQITDN